VVRFNEAVLEEVGAVKLSGCLEVLQKVNQIVERNNIFETVGR
jgi:hypothetical protein